MNSEGSLSAPNSAQAEYWNAAVGHVWAQYHDQLDRQIGSLGNAALAALAPAVGERVLDVGCGCGHTSADIAGRVGATGSVLGVDLSARIVAGAQARHPQAEFAVLDVLHSDPPRRPDFVIASGIMAVAVAGYDEYVLGTLRRFQALAGRGFGLNFLSTASQRPDGVSRYVEPAWLLGLFQRHISWRCRLIHDYRPNDFTLIHLVP